MASFHGILPQKSEALKNCVRKSSFSKGATQSDNFTERNESISHVFL